MTQMTYGWKIWKVHTMLQENAKKSLVANNASLGAAHFVTDNSKKLGVSTLTKVSFLIFWPDEHPPCAISAQLACSAKLRRQARQNLSVKEHFWKPQTIVRNYHPAEYNHIFLKVGNPSHHTLVPKFNCFPTLSFISAKCFPLQYANVPQMLKLHKAKLS